LAEEADVVGVCGAVFGFGAGMVSGCCGGGGGRDLLANHVEVDHGGDVDRIVLVRLCEVLGSEEALLFSCESSERD
jgi:hypothetical protein